jgi:hypothetical protein
MDAHGHFIWARDRAMEYLELGRAEDALSSLISDLNKHEGTQRIMGPLLPVAYGEYQLAGINGVRRFIEGLPEPRRALVDRLAENPRDPDAIDDLAREIR